MAHEAEPGTEPEEGLWSTAKALRFMEGLLFCLLTTVILLWVADRLRDLDFDPFTVTLCDGPACAAPEGEALDDRPWSVYTDSLDHSGLIVFGSLNVCRMTAEVLATRTIGPSEEHLLDLIQDRGTLIVTPVDAGSVLIAPGANNDGLWDVARDALRWQSPRGCFAANYTPIFWPLWTAWMLLASLRVFRSRQAEWAKR